MILDPVNSVASVDFYQKISRQSPLRSFGYVCYLALLFSVVSTVALKVKLGPVIEDTFTWLERSVPTLTIADGKVTSSNPLPTRLEHPKLTGVSVMIDTNRVEPVTPEQMEQDKVLAYLSSNAFYLKQQNGKLEVYPLGKSTAGQKPFTIDSAFFRNAGVILGRVLYPVALVVTFMIVLGWKGAASVAYSLMALMINAMANGGLNYVPLLNIAIYAQTLATAVLALSLFLPFAIPGLSLISLFLTGVYIWLAVKRHSSPSSPALA